MRALVTEQGVIIPKDWLNGAHAAELERRDGIITVTPITAEVAPMLEVLARIRSRMEREGCSAPSQRDFVREGRDGMLFGYGDEARHD